MSGPVESLLSDGGYARMAAEFRHLHQRWTAMLGTEGWSEADSLALLVELASREHHAPDASPAHGYRRERPSVGDSTIRRGGRPGANHGRGGRTQKRRRR